MGSNEPARPYPVVLGTLGLYLPMMGGYLCSARDKTGTSHMHTCIFCSNSLSPLTQLFLTLSLFWGEHTWLNSGYSWLCIQDSQLVKHGESYTMKGLKQSQPHEREICTQSPVNQIFLLLLYFFLFCFVLNFILGTMLYKLLMIGFHA